MNYEKIEQSVRELQTEIWHHRDSLWTGIDLPPVHRMFTIEVATKVLGIKYEVHAGLGGFGNGSNRFEVAGLIDRQNDIIAISQNFSPIIQRFTGAHEIGHWQLHKSKIVMHRDRQIAGLSPPRGAKLVEEKEADYYSACYLAPRNVVRAEFEKRFGPIDEFRCNDDAAFGLCASNPRSLINSSNDSLEWELALSSAIRFHGSPFFESLAELFLVSNYTMAIRLREVGLQKA